ncbi:MAG TPA: bifunctional 4-hydroxy-2-oxoglutarate aldolase/2-dehydro-3-deoxy-phosphogluconate aldolase [Candidatus Nanopelagicaceae bacterium]|nr:bifunctional 4-hydroxy-2-oxoglutarate aldolase/2-dehydro-3-deoxy-phosphogluconate aldolase [Candidatus Nanopelagicaceae bacterium]
MSEIIPGLSVVPLIGIVRGHPLSGIEAIADGAAAGGLMVLEITLDSPQALEQIAAMRAAHPELTVGAGSVLEPSQVGEAADAGATFFVTPTCNPAVIAAALHRGLPIVSGAATPTEIRTALAAGATAVKVFPAHLLGGVAFLDAVMSPLGNPPLVPTGGVDLRSAREYLAHGALAVGVGSALFPSSRSDDPAAIVNTVRSWVEAVK